jgi:hypothetical protein
MASRHRVDDLIDLAPPPEWRIDAGSPGAWDAVERALGTALPDDYKLITNPEPGGLLPLGGDLNGGHAFWLTEGAPEAWPLVIYPDWTEIERHDIPLVDFLVMWLSGALPDCFGGVGKEFLNRTDPVFRNGHQASARS